MTPLAFRLFGRLEILVDGGARRLTPAAAVVMCRLLLARGQLVGTRELFDAMRPGHTDPLGREQRVAVQKRINEIRTLLDPGHPGESSSMLLTDRGTTTAYRLVVDRDGVDIDRFGSLVDRARSEPSATAAATLREALELWRDPPLLDVADRGFAVETVRLLTRTRDAALRSLTALEDGTAAAPPASHGRAAAHTDRSSPVTPRQLPATLRHFVGRREELDVLTRVADEAAATDTVAIAVISGAAGIGKSALAVRWAHQVAGRFPDGQLHVDLRGFGPPDEALEAGEAIRMLLGALSIAVERIPEGLAERAGLYRSVLAERRMLIVVENVRAAEDVRALLPGNPGCLVVITSRSRLIDLVAIEGARAIVLAPLSHAEAHDLIAHQLGRERVDAEPEAVAALIGLCARVPLALSTAAAWAALGCGAAPAALVAKLAGGDVRPELPGDPERNGSGAVLERPAAPFV